MRNTIFERDLFGFTVTAYNVPDPDPDTSWMDDEAEDDAADLLAFGTIVEVSRNGHIVGQDALWGSFVTGWDDPYLIAIPAVHDMVGNAIADARRTLTGR